MNLFPTAMKQETPPGMEQLMRYCRLIPLLLCLGLPLFWNLPPSVAGPEPPPGFVSLFNGKDFTGWTVPEGDNGHWKVLDG